MSAIIDTASEPGSWAETLASPSCKIQSVLALLANAGASNVSPVNSPAAGNGGGHLFPVNHHEADNG